MSIAGHSQSFITAENLRSYFLFMRMFSSKVVLVISCHDTARLLIRVQVVVLLAAFALRACARDNICIFRALDSRALDKVVDTEDVADSIELSL